MPRLDPDFFHRDCLEVAPQLVGKILCHRLPDGRLLRLRISETEAYRGEEDTACHAHKGLTPRTKVLYGPPGVLYIYLCYGMHNLLNVVTGEDGVPQGVLIRACVTAPGPGMLTKRPLRKAISSPSSPVFICPESSVCASKIWCI